MRGDFERGLAIGRNERGNGYGTPPREIAPARQWMTMADPLPVAGARSMTKTENMNAAAHSCSITGDGPTYMHEDLYYSGVHGLHMNGTRVGTDGLGGMARSESRWKRFDALEAEALENI